MPNSNKTIIYFLGTFPLLSQTFVRREILALRKAGIRLQIIAGYRRNVDGLSEEEQQLVESTIYLPSPWSPVSLLNNLFCLLTMPIDFLKSSGRLLFLPHRSWYHRGRALYHWLQLGSMMRAVQDCESVVHIHAHFASWQTELSLAVGAGLNIPVSFTGHAQDIYKDRNALQWKMQWAEFMLTCTDYNHRYLHEQCAPEDAGKITTLYHPLDPRTLQALDEPRPVTDGEGRPLILSVGRLVPKKGFCYLLDACASLREQGQAFECVIVGGGPLAAELQEQVDRLQLNEHVQLAGAVPFEEVQRQMRQASVFVMPSIVLENGDRDGIPNVLIEAMALGIPPVATNVSGLPEPVVNEQTGLLVPPHDVMAITKAVARLLNEPELCRALGDNARQRVAELFGPDQTADKIVALFQEKVISRG
jgi:glycosyltransferase involved in cell wall biosynthesis